MMDVDWLGHWHARLDSLHQARNEHWSQWPLLLAWALLELEVVAALAVVASLAPIHEWLSHVCRRSCRIAPSSADICNHGVDLCIG